MTIVECLAQAPDVSEIPYYMNQFETLRRDRCYVILDGARNNGGIWHLLDGPEQLARDVAMRVGAKPLSAGDSAAADDNPNRWSDPKFQPWMFGHDASAYAREHLHKKAISSNSFLKPFQEQLDAEAADDLPARGMTIALEV